MCVIYAEPCDPRATRLSLLSICWPRRLDSIYYLYMYIYNSFLTQPSDTYYNIIHTILLCIATVNSVQATTKRKGSKSEIIGIGIAIKYLLDRLSIAERSYHYNNICPPR